MRLGRTIISISVGLVLLSGCGVSEPEAKPQSTDAIPVAVSIVQPASENELIVSAGTVRLRRETSLGFTTGGQVASVRFEEGDRVKRGAVLAALDNSNVAADLGAARAERDRAESEFGRIEKLFKDGWVTKARLEQSEAALRAARAKVQSTEFASRTASIIAPGNGIILTRNIDAGQIVAAGTTALVIGEVDKGFVLRVPMTDADAARVNPGMRAKVFVSAISDLPIDAVVSEKDARADERTGTFEVSFLLPGNDRLRSGQLGKVEVEVSRNSSASLAIPANAIFGIRTGEGLVFVVDSKNRVRQRNVSIGELTDRNLEILTGLKEGDVIVTRGVEKLRDGDLIKPIRAAE
ncbi:efflux RND transporter periplasmic adaptor subunit [Parasphingorhabdus flavimaris]|jgi:RND family efflux transporter MFP subunit|uniref:Efflux RND transporter periplasmic adaptor subunit n=1 Tax=Parasphingorhabdus flavimaris TaxID=266812 RepID=A0ABX2N732_9SPHN|nr:efflux RND transporter periplasmic adaptor subunit [Parasphingorhabdus flavimaris]NVD29351.1 efflux RND transporter periplasmic adaptor subunit [Parasphingorhabdus flavimaris]|tara:strand:+ start:7402 stop:8454 length:1053 start_codon:yes stop_codon:yes gene_type:complete